MRLTCKHNISIDDGIDLSKYIPYIINDMRLKWSLAGGGTSNLKISVEEFGYYYDRPIMLCFEMTEDRRRY